MPYLSPPNYLRSAAKCFAGTVKALRATATGMAEKCSIGHLHLPKYTSLLHRGHCGISAVTIVADSQARY